MRLCVRHDMPSVWGACLPCFGFGLSPSALCLLRPLVFYIYIWGCCIIAVCMLSLLVSECRPAMLSTPACLCIVCVSHSGYLYIVFSSFCWLHSRAVAESSTINTLNPPKLQLLWRHVCYVDTIVLLYQVTWLLLPVSSAF